MAQQLDPTHMEPVHQYITREAFNLLNTQTSASISSFGLLSSHIGNTQERNARFSESYVVAGAFDADWEDVVYMRNVKYPPETFPGSAGIFATFSGIDPWISITHFWQADYADDERNTMEGTYNIGFGDVHFYIYNVHNAYQAAESLAYRGAKYKLMPSDFSVNLIFQKVGGGTVDMRDSLHPELGGFLYISYDNLYQLYTTGTVYLRWNYDQRNFSSNWTPTWRDVGLVNLTNQQKDFLTWDILGRLCHLLQDMSVPAHAHRDIHGSDDPGIRQDYYERFYALAHHPEYTFANVGQFLNQYFYTQTNPLHFLFYTTNQISDYFSSNGPYNIPGNETWGGDGTADEIAYLNEWKTWALSNGLPGVGYPGGGNVNETTAEPIFRFCFPQAIKATAGLMAWFMREITGTQVVTLENSFKSGVINVNSVGDVISGGLGLWQTSTTQSLFGPNQHARQDGNPSNPQIWWVHQSWKKNFLDPVFVNPYSLQVEGFTTMLGNYTDNILASAQTSTVEGGSGGIVRAAGFTSVEGASFTNQPVQRDASGLITVSAIPNPGYVFYKWGDGSTQNPRYFTSSPVSVAAVFKAHLGSSLADATSNNSQRKLTKDDFDGAYTLSYASSNEIWLTQSAFGSTWTPEVLVSDNSGGFSAPSVTSKEPDRYIVYRKSIGPNYQVYFREKRVNTWQQPFRVDNGNVSANPHPVAGRRDVDIGQGQTAPQLLVLWEGTSNLQYRYAQFYSDPWTWNGPYDVPSSNGQKNPSISSVKSLTGTIHGKLEKVPLS